ncbi:hypothetical protein Goarm_018654 [Gossypium armourianum]|uniref:Uncharacterized protein n=1 Tax=Gossypium armourianum TaxID=34283 RepID=A0A7J9II63_9ROSI|nr:hypothetical protein [Gossypium armourianum]
MCICVSCDCCKAICNCKAGDANCTDLILAMVMPPIGVLRKRGPKVMNPFLFFHTKLFPNHKTNYGLFWGNLLQRQFWLSVCLTMALFLPGSIYAVTVVISKENNGTK